MIEPSVETAGLACQIDAFPELGAGCLRRDRRDLADAGRCRGPGSLFSRVRSRSWCRPCRNRCICDTPRRIPGSDRSLPDSGRGPSHLQEQPLTSAGSRRALTKTGACRQLGSRTASGTAVPQSPSIRERACPARPGPAPTTRHMQRRRGSTYSAESTGPRATSPPS